MSAVPAKAEVASREPVIEIQDLSIALPPGADRPFAVERVDLTVGRGEIVCVVGESGSGKSVLSAAIMGAVPGALRIAGGRILFQGRDIAKLPEAELRRFRGRSAAMIFQEPIAALNPSTPVGEQIAEMFAIHEPSMGRAERDARVLELMQDVHLPDPQRLRHRLPHQLSGGQCQRIVIAMALALQPALLIADEPTTALDVTTQAQILKLVAELRDGHGHGILFITHDIGVVADIADRICVMRHGRIVETGTRREILEDAKHPYTRMLLDAVPKGVSRPAEFSDAPDHLVASGLTKNYGRVNALDKVTLRVRRGSTIAVVGESGSGKSTLAQVLVRLIEPSDGEVRIGEVNFTQPSAAKLRSLRSLIQMIFQDPYGSLNPRRTVRDVVVRAGILGGLAKREAHAQARDLVARVGLPPEALDRLPAAFSGGQRQRIGIARALAMRPEIVVADECVSALDVSVQRQVLDLLNELKRERGLTLVFITHDLRVAAELADELVVMQRGRVVENGPAHQVLHHPAHPYSRALIAAIPGQSLA